MRCLLVFAIVVGSSSVGWASDCKVSKAQYAALKSGMSYAQVVSILGCEGDELSSSEFSGYSTVMYMWEGDSFGANMNVMLLNGKLVNKAQFGLE
jgi:hypothetical protein